MIFRLRGPIFNHSVSSGSASSGPVEIFSRKNYLPLCHVLFHRSVYLRGTGRRQPGLVILSRSHTSSLPRPHRNIFFGEGSGDIKRHFVAPDVRNKLARILYDTALIGHRFEIPNPGRIAGVSELEQLARLRPISETISPVNTAWTRSNCDKSVLRVTARDLLLSQNRKLLFHNQEKEL